MTTNDPAVKAIYDNLKTWIDGTQELDSGSIVLLVTMVIGLVQKNASDKDGNYKKNLAMTVIRLIVDDAPNIDDETRFALHQLVDMTVPSMIDAMIQIAHTEIDLGKTVKKIKGCFGQCF